MLLAGRSDSQTPGLLPNARLIAVDVFHRAPDGGDATDVFDLVRDLATLGVRGASVINLSLAGRTEPLPEEDA